MFAKGHVTRTRPNHEEQLKRLVNRQRRPSVSSFTSGLIDSMTSDLVGSASSRRLGPATRTSCVRQDGHETQQEVLHLSSEIIEAEAVLAAGIRQVYLWELHQLSSQDFNWEAHAEVPDSANSKRTS